MTEKYRYLGLGTKKGVVPALAKLLPEYSERIYMVFSNTPRLVERVGVSAGRLCEPLPGLEDLIVVSVGPSQEPRDFSEENEDA